MVTCTQALGRECNATLPTQVHQVEFTLWTGGIEKYPLEKAPHDWTEVLKRRLIYMHQESFVIEATQLSPCVGIIYREHGLMLQMHPA